MGRAAAAAAPADPKAIMEARRAAYREEQGLPDVKWSCFAEQRKHEDFAAVRFLCRNHATALSRHRRDSSPSHEAVGGLFFDFEPVRTHRSNLRKSKRPCRPRARSPTKKWRTSSVV